MDEKDVVVWKGYTKCKIACNSNMWLKSHVARVFLNQEKKNFILILSEQNVSTVVKRMFTMFSVGVGFWWVLLFFFSSLTLYDWCLLSFGRMILFPLLMSQKYLLFLLYRSKASFLSVWLSVNSSFSWGRARTIQLDDDKKQWMMSYFYRFCQETFKNSFRKVCWWWKEYEWTNF